jgi:hypothetical protein
MPATKGKAPFIIIKAASFWNSPSPKPPAISTMRYIE